MALEAYMAYAAAAAQRWASARAAAEAAAEVAAKTAAATPAAPRAPGLVEYAARAAKRWEVAAAAAAREAARPVAMQVGRVVGRAAVRGGCGGVFSVRRAWWGGRLERRRAELVERMKAEGSGGLTAVVSCGIPKDLRQQWAAVWRSLVEEKKESQGLSPRRERWVGGEGCVGEKEGVVALAGCGEFIARAKEGWTAGARVFVSVAKAGVDGDEEAEVRRRYNGRPDELYCRRTARRWSVWRRAAAARAADAERAVVDAEREMKRRRGTTGCVREEGAGVGFVGYRWDTDEVVYAACDKINGKKALRERMLAKYGSVEAADEVGLREKAEIMAQTKELFHTKVMNRFA